MVTGIKLHISVKDADGAIISETCKNNDLYLWNFAVMITHWIKRWNKISDPTSYQYTDINGTVQTITSGTHVWASHNYDGYNYNIGNWGNTLRAVLGSGSTPPVITDYCLNQQVAEAVPTSVALVTAGNVIKQLFSATFPMAEETIGAEIGLRMKMMDNVGTVLITRDIFVPVTIPAGGSLTVQYEFWWNGTPPEV